MISRRALLAIGVSAALLAVVLWVADLGAVDLSKIQPIYILPTVLAYMMVLILRGVLLRHLTDSDQNLWRWISLAGRHQFVFILAPSGSGDLAFPVLANRMVGLGLGSGAALIAGVRLRDICAVLGLGCVGLWGIGIGPLMAACAAILFGLALYFSDITVGLAGRLIGRFRSASGTEEKPKASRLPAALLTLILWLVASGGIMAGFAAAGFPLTIFQAWVMLAGLNLAGAIAVSLAGIGVAEAGAAGVLVFLGVPLAEAAAIALVARPILLLSNTAASGMIEVTSRFTQMSKTTG